ncbi:FAD/NAD(P)-binding protein [Streptomyces longwoodensis]|uniref:FAD/NAD(P)-binding protein n=1 Tax=Streptomyces longwoodensis TaxID=68231 RepID=UPI00379294F1
MRASPLTLALVGGGAAATCILVALSQHLIEASHTGGGTVLIFEPRSHLWRGRVYQPDGPEVLTNVPACAMSVQRRNPDDAVEWLASLSGDHPSKVSHRFVPRALIGDYLVSAAQSAVRCLREAHWQTHIVPERAVRLSTRHNGFVVRGERSQWSCSDVVLCVGGADQADPYELAGQPGYIAHPYPTREKLADVQCRSSVLVLGTGLTAVDTVIALAAQGHEGHLTLASRRGLLPAVREWAVPHEFVHLTVDGLLNLSSRKNYSLMSLVDLVSRELSEARFDPVSLLQELNSTEVPLHRLRRHLITGSPDGLHILEQAIPRLGQLSWHLLPAADKKLILERYHHHVMSLCCPMAPRNAAILAHLSDIGQLDVHSGLRSVVRRADGGFLARTETTEMMPDVVISAVTPAVHTTHDDARDIVTGLVADGLARTHHLGGLQVEFGTGRIVPDRKFAEDPKIYALGDLTHGSLYFTFGLSVLVRQADDIARALLESIS